MYCTYRSLVNLVLVKLQLSVYFNCCGFFPTGQTGESLDWNLVAKYKAGRTGGQATRLSVYTELAKLRTQEALLLGSSNSYTFNSTFVLTRVKKVIRNILSRLFSAESYL